MAYDDLPNGTETGDEALLREIRDRYRYAIDSWREIREERQIDLRYLCGQPWSPKDKKERDDDGRPCLSHDELNQYINQGVNGLRQNKRGIVVEPRAFGASEKSAELRQDIIRTIEHQSRAQSAYLRGGQDMFEGGYGFFRITHRYVDQTSFDQEIVIKPLPNPDAVLYDPDTKEADWSDAAWCFVLDPMPKEVFKRKYPKATKKDFTSEDLRVAKDWLQDKTIVVAEYWKVTVKVNKLYELYSGEILNDLPKGEAAKNTREVETKTLMQYITNGVEILERIKQPGEEIPIPAMVGLERFTDYDGKGPKRKIFSLCRLARDPQMSLAYLVSQQTEEAGLTPKTPYIGYQGQFDADRDAWQSATRFPHAFLEVTPIVDNAGGQVLPLPRREPFTPNFAAYEIAKDSARRAIQAAMGISPLPTSAQRENQKSGVALQRIQQQQAIGSYHFVEGYERAITRAGRIIDSWLPTIYDNERQMALRRADDSNRFVTLNTDEPYRHPQTGEMEQHQLKEDHIHDINVTAGPSSDSQREEVNDFVGLLVQNLQSLPIAPPQAAQILSILIRMKNMGPKGDELADLISPQQQNAQLSPQAQQALQQANVQFQKAQQVIQFLHGELQKLSQEKQAKVVDNEYKMQIEKLKIDAQLAMTEVTTKSQQLNERLKWVTDLWQQLHGSAHEAGMQQADQQHELAMQIADQNQQAGLQQADQSHEANMQQSDQQHAIDLGAQQAEQPQQEGVTA